MKNTMILVLVSGLTLVSGVSAMEMMDSGAMMHKDNKMMMPGSMDKTMMKDDAKMMAKKSTAAVAASMGYTWSKDRSKLAEMAGVVGYRGTAKQNLIIRTYLIGMMKDKMTMSDTMTK
jgi:hypothetical protein